MFQTVCFDFHCKTILILYRHNAAICQIENLFFYNNSLYLKIHLFGTFVLKTLSFKVFNTKRKIFNLISIFLDYYKLQLSSMFQTKTKMVGVFEVFFFFLCNLPATRPLQSACNERDNCNLPTTRPLQNLDQIHSKLQIFCQFVITSLHAKIRAQKVLLNFKRSLAVKCVAGYITFTEVKKKINRQTLGFVGIFSSFRKRDIRGFNRLPYLLSTSVSLAVIKDFSTNYMAAHLDR